MGSLTNGQYYFVLHEIVFGKSGSSNLLLAFVIAVILGFGPRRDP
jgi:hypothetical protein